MSDEHQNKQGVEKPALEKPSLEKQGQEKQAVALSYDGKRAPIVSAEGSGDLAEQIIALARQHGVPLFENAPLLALLQEVDLGDEIPETLYLCIAQVLSFAYRIQGKKPEGFEQEGWEPVST